MMVRKASTGTRVQCADTGNNNRTLIARFFRPSQIDLARQNSGSQESIRSQEIEFFLSSHDNIKAERTSRVALHSMSPSNMPERKTASPAEVVFLSVECFAVLFHDGVRNLWKIVFTSCSIFSIESTHCLFFPGRLENKIYIGLSFQESIRTHFQTAARSSCAAVDTIRRTLPIDIIRDDCARGWRMMLKPAIIFGFRLIRDIFVRVLAVGLYVLGTFFPFVGQLLWPTVRPDTGAAKYESIKDETHGSTIEMNDDVSFVSDLSNDQALLSPVVKTPVPQNLDSFTVSIYSATSPLSTVSEDEGGTSNTRQIASLVAPEGVAQSPEERPPQLPTDADEDTEEDISISILVNPFPTTFQRHPIEAIRSKWNHYADMEERGVLVAPRYRTKVLQRKTE
jgi:hypothetical protein